jgi:hypothetical protein
MLNAYGFHCESILLNDLLYYIKYVQILYFRRLKLRNASYQYKLTEQLLSKTLNVLL